MLIFFQERGKRMAMTNLAVFGGAFFTPILVGKITHTIGWWWTFYFVAIFAGVCLPLVFFLVPETAYRRDFRLNTDMASTEDIRLYTISSEHEKSPAGISAPEVAGHSAVHVGAQTAGAMTPLAGWKERLQLFNGRKTDESFFKLFLRPFPLFAHPGEYQLLSLFPSSLPLIASRIWALEQVSSLSYQAPHPYMTIIANFLELFYGPASSKVP